MKPILLSLIALCFSSFVYAQGEFKFEEENHTFDAIMEGDVASYDFKFTNIGNKPLEISHVQPGCGCTTPTWTKEPIWPGKQGVITAAYNSAGRPGPFSKTISVTSNGKISSFVLSFRGVVLKKAEAGQATESSPKLVLDKNFVSIGKIEYQQKVTNKFIITNSGKSPLKINDVQSACICTSYKISKPEIPAGESATLEITFTGMNQGAVEEKVYISSNDGQNPYTKLIMKVNVVNELNPKSIMKEGQTAIPFK